MAAPVITQDWENYPAITAREDIRQAYADLLVNGYAEPAICHFTGELDANSEEQWTWLSGNNPLQPGTRSGSVRFFGELQSRITTDMAAFLVSLWYGQRPNTDATHVPWIADSEEAFPGMVPEPTGRWICQQAGLFDSATGGYGLRFSPGTEKELGIDDDADKPVVYYPFSADEVPTPWLQSTFQVGHISGPWLTQDLSMLLRFLLRCRDVGILNVIDYELNTTDTRYDTTVVMPTTKADMTYSMTDTHTETFWRWTYWTILETTNSVDLATAGFGAQPTFVEEGVQTTLPETTTRFETVEELFMTEHLFPTTRITREFDVELPADDRDLSIITEDIDFGE